jgi:hypothetical protein
MKPSVSLRALLPCFGSSLLGVLPASSAILYYDGGTVEIVTDGNSAAFGTVNLTSNITVGSLISGRTGYNISTGSNTLTFGGTNNTVTLNKGYTGANTGTVNVTGFLSPGASFETLKGTHMISRNPSLFPFPSMFNVGRSTFDVHLPISNPQSKIHNPKP